MLIALESIYLATMPPRIAALMRALFDLVRALAYATGFVVLWGWLALLVRPLDRFSPLVLPAWSPGAGLVLLVGGSVLALTCVAGFAWWGGGTPAPFDPPRRFVARGPYRFVRNPMYVGGFAVLLGYGLLALSPSILCLSLVMLGCAHLFVVWYEEPSLERRFGEGYRAYCRTVHRWRPRFAGRNLP